MKHKQNGTCRIVAAGDFDPTLFRKEEGDLVIAADAGFAHLKKAGIACDLYIGDSDSLGFDPREVDSVVLPRIKDDTDTLAAVKEGLSRGYCRFCLYGALGGKRFSHSLANLSTLLYLDTAGAEGVIWDKNGCIALFPEGTHRLLAPCHYFSLFAAHEKVRISISGAKYNLENAPLSPDFPLGVSNEGGNDTEITVHEGKVFLILDF